MIEMTEQELGPLREVALSLLNDVAVIERYTEQDDGALGTIETWEALYQGVPCRVAESIRAGEQETTQAGKMTSRGEHVVRVPYGTDIRESDRIRIRVNRFDRVFDVARVIEHSYATVTTVICTEAR